MMANSPLRMKQTCMLFSAAAFLAGVLHGGGSRDATLAEEAYARFRKGERPYFTPTKP